MSEYYWNGNIGFSASKRVVEAAMAHAGLYDREKDPSRLFSRMYFEETPTGTDADISDLFVGRYGVEALRDALQEINDPTARGEIFVSGDEDYFWDIKGTEMSAHDITEEALYYATDEDLAQRLTERGWVCTRKMDEIGGNQNA